MAPTLSSREIRIEIKKDADGTVYVRAPEYGLTVKGANREEARAKMQRALKGLLESEGQDVLSVG